MCFNKEKRYKKRKFREKQANEVVTAKSIKVRLKKHIT